MKQLVYFFLPLFLLISSCQRDLELNCRSEKGQIICNSFDNKEFLTLKNGKITQIKRIEGNQDIVWNFNTSGELISKLFFKKANAFSLVKYKNGNISSAENGTFKFRERISFFVENGNRYYTVSYELPNLNELLPVYYFAKNKKGEMFGDHYYYRITKENLIVFETNDKSFQQNAPFVDSSFIDYTREFYRNVPYVRVSSDEIFPNLKNFRSERAFMFNKLFFRGKKEVLITGLYWSFVKNQEKRIHYHDVIVCGDLLSRVNKFDSIVEMNQVNSETLFDGLESNSFDIRKGKTIVPNEDLLQKVKALGKK